MFLFVSGLEMQRRGRKEGIETERKTATVANGKEGQRQKMEREKYGKKDDEEKKAMVRRKEWRKRTIWKRKRAVNGKKDGNDNE